MINPHIRAINAGFNRSFSYSLSERNLHPRTIRGAFNALRSLFRFLVEQGAFSKNPTLDVRYPKRDAAVRLLVTDDDLVKPLEPSEPQRALALT